MFWLYPAFPASLLPIPYLEQDALATLSCFSFPLNITLYLSYRFSYVVLLSETPFQFLTTSLLFPIYSLRLSSVFPFQQASHSISATIAVPQSWIASSALLCASITTRAHFHHFYAPIYSVYFSAPPTRITFSLRAIHTGTQSEIL